MEKGTVPLEKVNGIVVRYANYKDNDRILTLFTPEKGLVSAKARGCRRPKSPLLAGSELFAYGEYVLFSAGEKYTVDSCEVDETFYPVREDISRFAAGSFMISVAAKSGASGENCTGFFTVLYHSLSYLAYTDIDAKDAATVFAAKWLSAMGIAPAVTSCSQCGRDIRRDAKLFFSSDGGVRCASCRCDGDMQVSALSMEALRRIILMPPEDMKKVRLPDSIRNVMFTVVRRYIQAAMDMKFDSLDMI